MDLQTLVEKFIDEQIEFHHMSVRQTVHVYQELIGSLPHQQGSAGPASMSFIQFLKTASGIKLPQTGDLTNKNISSYQDYLEQYYGLLRAKSFIQAMKRFWTWTADNGLFLEPIDPPRLQVDDEAIPSYRLHIKISVRR